MNTSRISDSELRLRRANKEELRQMVRAYRFLALHLHGAYGWTDTSIEDEIEQIESQALAHVRSA